MSAANTPRRAPRGSLVVLAVLLVLWACWLVWALVAPDANANGQCEGLFFGCTLTPHDAARFVGALVLLPLGVLTLLVTAVVRLVRVRRGSPRTWADLVVAALLAAVALAWLAGTVTGAL